MGAASSFRLDHAGIAELLKSDAFVAPTEALARAIAAGIPGAEVRFRVTDRVGFSIGVAGGDVKQARDGVFTRAAAAVGATVTTKTAKGAKKGKK